MAGPIALGVSAALGQRLYQPERRHGRGLRGNCGCGLLPYSGRLRGEFDISLKWELVEDLFRELSFYDSYDNKPVVPGAEKNDYGVNTSLGWDF